MTLPSRRLVGVLAATLPVAVLPAVFGAHLWPIWGALVVALAVTVLADLVLTLPSHRLDVEVSAAPLLYIGDEARLGLAFATRWLRAATIEGLVEVDGDFVEPPPFRVVVAPGDATTLSLPLVPRRRGEHRIRSVWLRWRGPLGLVERSARVPIEGAVRVVPNIAAVRRAALRFFSNRDFLAGLKVERYTGEGSEFDALREFVPGYDPRAIDWKASARHTKLLCRDYRAERNHHVVMAFDTGYLMSEPLGGVPKLDHAINAGLLLAYVALRTGDRVGLYSFDQEARHFPPPQSGVTAMRRIQEQSATLEYSSAETNFTLGLTSLLGRLRRRSLVVLFTDFVDTVTAELMLENVRRLGRRHVVLFVALRDTALDGIERARLQSVSDLTRAVVAGDLIRERATVLRRLVRRGVLTVDVPPERLTTQLINQYLDIKRRELVA